MKAVKIKKIIAAIITIALCVLIILPIALAYSPRDKVLKIYNVDEYIDPELLSDFEQYYKAVTGESIKVEYMTFPTNESMLNKIAGKKSDYDIVVPSDYMVEKMIRLDLLQPLYTTEQLTSLIKDSDVYSEWIEGYYEEWRERMGYEIYFDDETEFADYRKSVSQGGCVADMFKDSSDDAFFTFDKDGVYSAPYMWGTLGIVYNFTTLKSRGYTGDNLEQLLDAGWSVLWDNAFRGRIDMKDSIRDTYAAGALYTYNNNVDKYGILGVSDILNNGDKDFVADVGSMLKRQKDILHEYETDTGKQSIIDGRTDFLLQWSGDAMYSIALAQESGVELGYNLPAEGSNLWLDCMCIPKYAKNVDAANLFINFMCMSSSSISNMEYIGYTSVNATPHIIDYWSEYGMIASEDDAEDYEVVDLSYFFGDIGQELLVYTDDYTAFLSEYEEDEDGNIVYSDDTAVYYNPKTDIGGYSVADLFKTQYPSIEQLERCAVMRDYDDETYELLIAMWTSIKGAW
ncbi:MAG: extracellular solute-binding protein [Clostridia bacterium]|nr:extracellular solute-binding protein [Clostridia bacterium]